MKAIADLVQRARHFLAPYDDRISVGEYAALNGMTRRQVRRAMQDRRRRICDTWINPDLDSMGRGTQSWVEPISINSADGTQVSNTTTETIVVPDFSIPGGYMYPLRTLRVWAFGVNSNVVTTPGTLTFRARWGGVAGTVLLASAAQGLDTTAHTNALWGLLAYITCRTEGTSGTFMSGGWINLFNVLASTAANLLPAMLGSAGTPGASGNAAVTVDTTVAKALSLTSASSVATSPTNVTCQMRCIESLN